MSRLGAVFNALTYGIFAKQPVAYAAPTLGGYSFGSSRPTGSLEIMGSVGTLYSVVDLLATSTARVGWHLYRTTTDRRAASTGDDNRQEVVTHPALNLLNNPNPLMTRNELVERTQQSIEVVGEGFWIVEYAGKMPVELWPVRADRMVEDVDKQGRLVGWKYREPTDGSLTPFGLEQVIHIQTPDPANPFRGISPVRSLLVDLESVKAAGRFNLAFFRNSARMGGWLKVPNALGDTELNNLAMQINERHRGVENAHRIGILENGIEYVDGGTSSMKDMEFANLRNLSRDLIREAYRVHKHMLGQSDDVNRANAVAAAQDFASWSLEPRLERIEQALNGSLLRLFGDLGKGVEFCHDNPMPPDPEQENADRDSTVTAVVALVNVGFDAEETLAAFGLPPIAWTAPPEPVPFANPAPPTDAQLAALLNRTRREAAR